MTTKDTTTITLPTPIKKCTRKEEHSRSAVHAAMLSYDPSLGGTVLATDGATLISIKNLEGTGAATTKLVHRDSLNNRMQGSRVELSDDMLMVESSRDKWSKGEYVEDRPAPPYHDVIGIPDEDKVAHTVTIDAEKLYNMALALRAAGQRPTITLYFPKNNSAISVDGGIGVGMLMPCNTDKTYAASKTRFNAHAENAKRIQE